MPQKVIVITGPTATGKTTLGIGIAKMTGGEVVSADSMQIYKYMDIGTAKPTAEETDGVPHHMIGTVSPFEDYSVSRYVEDASPIVEDILSRGKTPIIVGGTWMYIDALLAGTEFAPSPSDSALREKISAEYDKDRDACLERLRSFDPESAARLPINDRKRIVRAIEIYELTGQTITEHDRLSKLIPPKYDACKIALTFADRQDLYARINARVDMMMENGLADEVKKLLDMGVPKNSTAMQAIGYKELVSAINGEGTIEDAVEKIKQESRRYAKRQLSRLGSDKSVNRIVWKKSPDFAEGLRISTLFLEKFGII